ncbi:hypothetical protein [Actinoplanes sp. NPDC049265]|uniref:hypothetical protein n=1 Tax=Actinoplanes sp. NPDC049265 TaxID=3363902 RepID=UPI00370FCA51
MNDDELDRLARQDVALRFAPPAPGSDRYQRLLERAMTTNVIELPKPRRRRLVWTVAAAGVAASAIVAATVVLRVPAAPAPAEPAAVTMRLAADRITEVSSVRVKSGIPDPKPGQSWCESEVSGDRIHSACYDYGKTTPGSQFTRIGDTIWETDEHGKVTKQSASRPSDPDQEPRDTTPAPFTQAANHMIAAAAGDPSLRELGHQPLSGVDTRHFQITVEERSSAAEPVPAVVRLPKSELMWFDLEGLDGYPTTTLDFWVSDDHLIRRVGVTAPWGNSTTDFYDFNEPVTIEAPKV